MKLWFINIFINDFRLFCIKAFDKDKNKHVAHTHAVSDLRQERRSSSRSRPHIQRWASPSFWPHPDQHTNTFSQLQTDTVLYKTNENTLKNMSGINTVCHVPYRYHWTKTWIYRGELHTKHQSARTAPLRDKNTYSSSSSALSKHKQLQTHEINV